MNIFEGKSLDLELKILGFYQNERCSRVPSTPTAQNYAPNEVSRPKSFPRKKNIIFSKIKISQHFSLFSTAQNPDFRDLTDLAMRTDLPLCWMPRTELPAATRNFAQWKQGMTLCYVEAQAPL